MTIAEKLSLALDTKQKIKEAIISQGVMIADEPFSEYPDKIKEIGVSAAISRSVSTEGATLEYVNGSWVLDLSSIDTPVSFVGDNVTELTLPLMIPNESISRYNDDLNQGLYIEQHLTIRT